MTRGSEALPRAMVHGPDRFDAPAGRAPVRGRDQADAVWTAIRTLGKFTLLDIADEIGATKDSIRKIVRAFVLSGHVAEIGRRSTTGATEYRMIEDVGAEAPSVDQRGQPRPDHRASLWRAMRILKNFEPPLLAETAKVNLKIAQGYALALARAGFLQVATRHGKPTRPRRYVLAPALAGNARPPRLSLRGPDRFDAPRARGSDASPRAMAHGPDRFDAPAGRGERQP